MLVKFKITNKQYECILYSLKTTEEILLGNFNIIIDILNQNGINGQSLIKNDKEFCYKEVMFYRDLLYPLFEGTPKESIHNPHLNIIQILQNKLKNNSFSKKSSFYEFNIELNKDEIHELIRCLDLSIRLYLGQLNELNYWLYDGTINNNKISKKSYPDYLSKPFEIYLSNAIVNTKIYNLKNGFNFGINNPIVNDNAKIILDVKNTINYEYRTDAENYAPLMYSKEPLCEITFPYQHKIKILSDEILKELQPLQIQKDDIRIDENTVFLRTGNGYIFVDVKKGDIITKKYNGRYIIN